MTSVTFQTAVMIAVSLMLLAAVAIVFFVRWMRYRTQERSEQAERERRRIELEESRLHHQSRYARERIDREEQRRQAEMEAKRRIRIEEQRLEEERMNRREAAQREERQAVTRRMKKCPDCAEFVQADAKICRFCRHAFTQAEALAEPLAPSVCPKCNSSEVFERSQPGEWFCRGCNHIWTVR